MMNNTIMASHYAVETIFGDVDYTLYISIYLLVGQCNNLLTTYYIVILF